jgi:uncharacterized Zn finger protein
MARRKYDRRLSRYGWRPYVRVADRRAKAAQELAKRAKKGQGSSPIIIEGRTIASSFWGSSWCENLERYSDFANRLPRGRTYIRNGSVVDLRVEPGRVRALVSGRDLYEIDIAIRPLPAKRWRAIQAACAGRLGSLVELLRGSLSQGVMEVVTRRDEGLFPAPREIALSCSCPDWASMCKHVAATLYGVGARLDQQPELLFALRGVDPQELVAAAAAARPARAQRQGRRVLAADQLSAVFGVDIETGPRAAKAAPTRRRRTKAAAEPGRGGRAPAKRAAGGGAAGGRGARKKTAAPKRKAGSASTPRRRTARAGVKTASAGQKPPRKKAKRR